MKKLTFLITAGPTQEPLDPVRYLSNNSSGKMGFCLAEAARKLGHQVLLIHGPVSLIPPRVHKIIAVQTAKQMHQAVMRHYREAHVIIMVAAVADYRPIKVAKSKIKKTAQVITLQLVRNPDILKELAKKKGRNQILVGFAAETHSLIPNAKKKLKQKNCDWIALNHVSRKGIGFGADQNEITLLAKNGRILPLGRASKDHLARRIIQILLS